MRQQAAATAVTVAVVVVLVLFEHESRRQRGSMSIKSMRSCYQGFTEAKRSRTCCCYCCCCHGFTDAGGANALRVSECLPQVFPLVLPWMPYGLWFLIPTSGEGQSLPVSPWSSWILVFLGCPPRFSWAVLLGLPWFPRVPRPNNPVDPSQDAKVGSCSWMLLHSPPACTITIGAELQWRIP